MVTQTLFTSEGGVMSIQYRYKVRKDTLNTLNQISSNSDNLLIIHYSCERFYDIPDGRTPRITSIAVRYFEAGQTKSFSIHKVAEVKGIESNEIESNYDKLEKLMLTEFFDFVSKHQTCNWLHWNMRDINYGFEALENRFYVLGGEPVTIDNGKKYDLARMLKQIYGPNYIEHRRFEKIVEKNKITDSSFLPGDTEALAFKAKAYVRLHQSTLRKVFALSTIVEYILSGKLRTDAKWYEVYGVSPQGIFNLINSTWWASLIYTIIMLVFGGLVGVWIAG